MPTLTPSASASTSGGPPRSRRVFVLEAAVREQPENFDALVALGDAYHDDRHHQKAIETYERALRIQQTPVVLTNLGVTLHALGRTDEAVVLFDRALELDPAYWKAMFDQTVIYGNRKEYEKALERIARLKELRAKHPEIPPLDDLETHLRRRAASRQRQ